MVEWKHKNIDWWKWKIGKEVVGFYFNTIRNDGGVSVFEEDWDNLLILDAARFDVTKEVFNDLSISTPVKKRRSRGACTGEFMEKNFRGVFNDTVYISANPSIDDNELDTFHNVVTLWDSDWDDEEGTVLPDTVVEKSLEIGERYPEKRLVVHFLQPHYPFLGSNIGGSVEELRKDAKGDERHEDVNPWRMVRDGIYDPDEVWNAYVENHRKVIPKAYKLGDELPGKSVLTSDHGNAMGAPLIKSLDLIDIYGHPWGVHLDEIVEVPWVEIDSSQRKPIVEEKPAATSDISGDAKKRLKEIGYLA